MVKTVHFQCRGTGSTRQGAKIPRATWHARKQNRNVSTSKALRNYPSRDGNTHTLWLHFFKPLCLPGSGLSGRCPPCGLLPGLSTGFRRGGHDAESYRPVTSRWSEAQAGERLPGGGGVYPAVRAGARVGTGGREKARPAAERVARRPRSMAARQAVS